MAVHAYTGINGSGKSYEAVASAILPALKSGRRVVTNVTGLSFPLIRDYLGLLDTGELLQEDRLVVVNTTRLEEPNFFFDPEIQLPDGVQSVVQPGDLVVIDECWRFWGEDCKLSDEHKTFFRMHRHYAEQESGWTCDMVLMTQDLSGLNKFVKNILESNYLFSKMKTFGFANVYQVQVWPGKTRVARARLTTQTKKYDKKIFPLYKSYEVAGAKEGTVDDRIVFWKDWKFIGIIVFAVVMVGGCGFLAWKGYKGMQDGSYAARFGGEVAPVDGDVGAAPQVRTAVLAASRTPGVAVAQDQTIEEGRLLGLVEVGGKYFAWIRDGERIKEVEVQGGVIDGRRSIVHYQGKSYAF